MSLSSALWMAAANDFVFLVPILLVVGWLAGAREDAFFVFATVVVSVVISYGFGLVYAHPAPYQVHQTVASGTPENSFPSQHTAVMFSFAFAVLWRRYRRLGAGLLVVAAIVGVARVVVGYHWPVDIYAGILAALVGIGVLVLAESPVDALAGVFVGIDDRLRTAVGLD